MILYGPLCAIAAIGAIAAIAAATKQIARIETRIESPENARVLMPSIA
jgi:hypothetical protein